MRAIVRLAATVEETPSTITLRFPLEREALPGQFVMLWIPGDDELPMSLSYTDGPVQGVTVKAIGPTTRRILSLRRGATVGVRGPYGHGFDLSPRRVLVVAGGSGSAALAPAAEHAIRRGAQVTVALGATTRGELLFADRFREMGAKVVLATDDGSAGEKGLVTVPAVRLLEEGTFDAVWTCGPEVMMVKVAESARAHSVRAFCSVERHMKCALGLCDACALGSFHVCLDGPVLDAERLLAESEFGRFHRDASGRRLPG